jgi:hypothetical protein
MRTKRNTIAIQIHGVAKIVSRAPQRGQNALPGFEAALQFWQIMPNVSAFHAFTDQKLRRGRVTYAAQPGDFMQTARVELFGVRRQLAVGLQSPAGRR